MTLHPYYRTRLLLIVAAIVCGVIFWFVGSWFGIPESPRFDASLILQPSPVVAFIVVGVTLVTCASIGSAIAGTVRFDGGLFAAALGLYVLGARGGPMHLTLVTHPGRGTHLALALELLILGAFLALAWAVLWLLHRRGRLQGDATRDGLREQAITRSDQLYALAIHTAVTLALLLLLLRTDDKKQVFAAMAIAGFAGAMAAYSFSAARPSVYYWSAPLIVGLLGHVMGYANWAEYESGEGWKQPYVASVFEPLTRALPLDYAGIGVGCSIFGYWTARRGHRTREAQAAEATATTAAAPTAAS